MTAEATAIAVAPQGASGPLRAMVERLTGGGIHVDIVEDLGAAAQIASKTPEAPPCILLDLRMLVAGVYLEDIKLASERIRKTIQAIPFVQPIAITGAADAGIVVACLRAGAGDVLDIQLEGTAAARQVVQRIYQRQREHAQQALTARTLRAMIEDMLKDLIRTERRSIDLEQKLALFESVTGETATLGESRPPGILLVEPDREIAETLAAQLAEAGVTTYAFASGEAVNRQVDSLLTGANGVDLALVAAQLPGVDGLETVRKLRDHVPGLPAFLMTSVHDADLAARAADLGVVGFVQKPLPDVGEVVHRLAQLARDSLERTREQVYLHRIKARHERVLARYRSLPREP